LEKLATKYNKIFQLHPNNVATLPSKNVKYDMDTGLEPGRPQLQAK